MSSCTGRATLDVGTDQAGDTSDGRLETAPLENDELARRHTSLALSRGEEVLLGPKADLFERRQQGTAYRGSLPAFIPSR